MRRKWSHGDHKCWVRWGESGVRAVCTLLAYNSSPAEEGSQSGNRAAPRITSAYTFSGPTSEIQTDCGPLRCSEGVWLLWKCWKLWKDLWIMLWTWWLLSLLWFVVFATLHGGSSSQALSLEFHWNRPEVREPRIVSTFTNCGTIYCWCSGEPKGQTWTICIVRTLNARPHNCSTPSLCIAMQTVRGALWVQKFASLDMFSCLIALVWLSGEEQRKSHRTIVTAREGRTVPVFKCGHG